MILCLCLYRDIFLEEYKMNDDELKIEEIKLMIYEVRGRKIMLDSDLAKLYDYETKNFNRQIKKSYKSFQ